MSISMRQHWDKIYQAKQIQELGWYEATASPSLELIEQCYLSRRDPIVDIGSGATTLLGALLERGYRNITAIDISPVALEKARAALGPQQAARIDWVEGDITDPSWDYNFPEIALWHDRAVFHFFTESQARQNYLYRLRKVLKPGGFMIVAAFAIGGARRCSGLAVRNYDQQNLVEFLGPDFSLLESLDYTYRMPSGDLRPYIYAVFQRR